MHVTIRNARPRHAAAIFTTLAATSPMVMLSACDTLAAEASAQHRHAETAGRKARPHHTDPEQIVVTGAKHVVAGKNSALGSRSILETPFSISEVTSGQIKVHGAADINTAFAYDSSVKIANSGVASGNYFRVRGLLLDKTNGYKVDGLAFPYWFQDMPLDHFQSLDLLKGVGGFLYGFAAPGGILDFVSKQPSGVWQYSGDVGVRSTGIASQHIDFGGPLNVPGDVRVRVNVQHEEGYLYNGAYNEEHSGSLALTGSITPGLTWSLNALYVRTLQKGQINSIALNAVEGVITHLAAVNGKLDLGSAGAYKTNVNPIVTPTLNWNFAPDWNATTSYRYSFLDERFPGNTATINSNSGNYTNYAFNMNRYFQYNMAQELIEGKIDTGPIQQDIVTGASAANIMFYLFNPLPDVNIGTGNIYSYAAAPSIVGNEAGFAYDRQDVHYKIYQRIWQNALFASDTVNWGPVSVLAGLRYNDYSERDYAATTAHQVVSYNLHPITPSYAVTLDVAKRTKLYVSYAEALSTGLTTPTTGVSNPNQYLAPYTSKQYEAGIKTAYGIVNGSAAVFRINEPVGLYGAVLPGQTLPVYTLGGLARIQGIEVNAAVRITRDLTLTGSASELDATYQRGSTLLHNKVVSAIGKTIPGTSSTQGSMFAEYRVAALPGLLLNGGVQYIGRGYGDTLNLLSFPSSTTVDIGASYSRLIAGRSFTLRGNIQNLLDKEYWVYDQAQVSAAPPRTFSLNLQINL